MIRVTQLIDRSMAPWHDRSAVSSLDTAMIAARDLVRSVSFYARVFGFRPEEAGRVSELGSARLSGPGNLRLVIHREDAAVIRPAGEPGPLCFRVADLDATREALWDAGVAVSRDSGEPDQIFRHANGRALYIRDPHGNEIELVEDAAAAARPALHRHCRVARWGRAVRRRCQAAG